jgi:hypothetical protein
MPPNQSWLDRPFLGPMSVRQVGRGLRDALVTPIAQDEQALYEQRHANPVADLVASQHPAYGVPAAIQDAFHNPDNAMMELAGAVPFVKGLRGAHALSKNLARYGQKGARAGNNVMAGTIGVTGANAYERGKEIAESEGY